MVVGLTAASLPDRPVSVNEDGARGEGGVDD